MNTKKRNPITWVPTVYFAMGLPFIFLSFVSSLLYRDMGISKEETTFWTSLLILPWSLKPLLSIVMEVFGTKRIYVILTEIITATFFGLIVFSLPLPNSFTISLALMGVIALSGSTHDIAGDGVYMEQLDNATQSLYSGWQGAFYNLAKVLTNGGLVFLVGYLKCPTGDCAKAVIPQEQVIGAWQVVLGISALLMLCIGLYHFFVLPKDKQQQKDGSVKEKIVELWQIFVQFFEKKHIWYYLLFIFLYRFAEGLTVKILPFFLTDTREAGGIALSDQHYGLIYGTAGAAAYMIGSILAGYYVSSVGLKKAIRVLALSFNVPFAVYLIFAIFLPTNLTQIAVGIIFEYFGYGFGFVALTLFMMQQIAPGKYQMAHYAFANSLMNLGLMVPGIISGYLSKFLGYQTFFIVVMLCTIPALIITWKVPFTYDSTPKKEK
ncbi:MFS transporter [Capnocytophaga haemolytica]|jgi:ampG protein